MAYGVLKKGARLTIFNRTLEKAEELAHAMKLIGYDAIVKPTSELFLLKDFDIVLNSTSLGMGERVNETPVSKEYINNNHIVFDAVYVPFETRLLLDAREQGATIIHGTEMLLHQGIEQFKLYTGLEAPEHVMREALELRIKN